MDSIPLIVFRDGTVEKPRINIWRCEVGDLIFLTRRELLKERVQLYLRPVENKMRCFRNDFSNWEAEVSLAREWFENNEDVYIDNARIAAKEYMDTIPMGDAPYDKEFHSSSDQHNPFRWDLLAYPENS